jgi:mono/diheme cytochrome c family protein/DNA-binding beta-propeller fold protein YncE
MNLMRLLAALVCAVCGALVSTAQGENSAPTARQNYLTRCAGCHGAERLGGSGPALLPGNLERLRKEAAKDVIADGRIATQMPGFAKELAEADIQGLVDFVYAQPETAPRWNLADIRSSRIEHVASLKPDQKPIFDADPLNLFVVVEAGDHHATILDGDKLEPLARFPTRYALHGGPKFSPDGRYVYFASRDGWVSKYDIYGLQMVAEVRAGINTRNLAVSSDGRYVAVGNYLPHTLVIFDAADLGPLKVIEVGDRNGKSSRVSAVYDAAPRRSFVAALKDIPEVWEITYDDNAAPVYEGMVHDYQLGEGIAASGPFPVRRIEVENYLDDFFFDPSYDNIIGAAREGAAAQVINLNVRRKIATLALPGLPHLGSGITWTREGRAVLGTPNLKQSVVSVIDMKTWKPVAQIATLGPGFFLRGHENSRYLWVDNFNSKANDALQVIDKQSLEVVATLRPAPGKTAAHVEFTRDGKYALASIWDMEGAIVVYDANTLEEVKRIPMKKPSGKYNVYNKTTRSTGTSH